MTQKYSRLAKAEEKKARRTALTYIVLSGLAVVFMVLFGTQIITQVFSLLSIERESTFTSNDMTPPSPPRFTDTPSYVKEEDVTINGTAEAGSKIYLDVNGRGFEAITNQVGDFMIEIQVEEGENVLVAKATDMAGNTSADTDRHTITFDKTAPKLEVAKPTNDQAFSGSKSQSIRIEGQTDATRLLINDRIGIVDNNGKFSIPFMLQEGTNELTIKALDNANNETVTTLKVTFSL